MVEKKVYDGWAFSENEDEKEKINAQIYRELCDKYKISRSSYNCNFDDYDLVFYREPGYNHAEYHIEKNTTDLTNDEIALICDGGNLCFGYDRYRTCNGKLFYIFED